ncbi:MAG: MBL fold metallo-hydrolase, partial [Chthoniobacteraceae bacterium]|nr:MBL fold metallo-hydrolase [Chthoniobacteraceae bacterium]
MIRIPLEDNFTDVIGKAQRGLQLTDAALARQAGISPADLAAIKGGEAREPALRPVARVLGLDGDALLALARREWYPEHPVFARGFAMSNTTFDDMTVNSYLVWDAPSRFAAAFDTGADARPLLSILASESLKLRYIFLTHTHADHIADL